MIESTTTLMSTWKKREVIWLNVVLILVFEFPWNEILTVVGKKFIHGRYENDLEHLAKSLLFLFSPLNF